MLDLLKNGVRNIHFHNTRCSIERTNSLKLFVLHLIIFVIIVVGFVCVHIYFDINLCLPSKHLLFIFCINKFIIIVIITMCIFINNLFIFAK